MALAKPQEAPELELQSAATESAATLMREAASGSAAATTRLLRLLAPKMARVVRGVLGPGAPDTDDALQQALVGLVHAIGAFRGECPPEGYACRIAFRAALAIRKNCHQARRRHDDSFALDTVVAPEPPATSRAEAMRKLLAEIPEEQAEALSLRVILGWSIDEIAEVAGVPGNTVRSRLRLAKEALRKRIDADPGLRQDLEVQS
jgi:RNA polymerase sigma factor (sigma-70 family)